MNKSLLLALVLIVVGGVGIYWFFLRPVLSPQEAPVISPEPAIVPVREELTLAVLLTDLKQAVGLAWEATPKQVRWKTESGELVLTGRGFGYGEDLGSVGVRQKFDHLDAWLKNKDFEADLYNPGSESAGKETRWYRKNNLVCYLGYQDNQAKGSSELEVACAEME